MKRIIKWCLVASLPFTPTFLYSQCNISVSGKNSLICGESSSLQINADWLPINSGTIHNIYASCFPDPLHGYLCGDSGLMLKSNNGGNSFQLLTVPFEQYWSIWFSHKDTGIAVGSHGIILRTTNGGVTWNTISTGFNGSFKTIFFISNDTGFAAGTSGTFYQTIDGGVSWNAVMTNITNTFNDLWFYDSKHGFAATDGAIFKTINGGSTWIMLYQNSSFGFNSLAFKNKDTGFVAGQAGNGFILQTVDGGFSWTTSFTSSTFSSYNIRFDQYFNIYSAGNGIYRSMNNGKDWESLAVSNLTMLRTLSFRSGFQGICAGGFGSVYLHPLIDSIRWVPSFGLNDSTSSGPLARPSETTMYSITAKTNGCVASTNFTLTVTPLKMITSSNYVVNCGDTLQLNIGINAANLQGIKIKWTPANYLSADSIYNPIALIQQPIQYQLRASTNNGCIDSATIVVDLTTSANAGLDQITACGNPIQLQVINDSWKKTSLNKNSTGVVMIQSVNKDTFFMLSGRRIYKSMNGGITWGDNLSDTNNSMYHLAFRNSMLGYLSAFSNSAMNSVILKTTNGGQTWQSQTTGGNYSIPSIQFTTDLNGFAIANPGKILKTLNGGNNWNAVASGTNNGLNALYMINNNNGYAVGNAGTVVKTTNGGTTWQVMSSSITDQLNGVYFIGIDTGFALCNARFFWRTTTGGNSWIKVIIDSSTSIYPIIQDMVSIAGKGLYAAAFYQRNPNWIDDPKRGIIYHSVDGGLTWTKMWVDTMMAFTAISGDTVGNILAAGNGDYIFKLGKKPDWFSWSPTTGLSDPSIGNPIAQVNATRQYIVQAGSGNCFNFDTIQVDVKPMRINVDDSLSVVCGDSTRLKLNTVLIDIDATRQGLSSWIILDSLQHIVLQSVSNIRTTKYMDLASGNYTFKCTPKVIPPPLYIRIIPFSGDSISETILWSSDSVIIRKFQIPSLQNYSLVWLTAQKLIGPSSISEKFNIQIHGPAGCSNNDSVWVMPIPLKITHGTSKQIECGQRIALDSLKSNASTTTSLRIKWKPNQSLDDSSSIAPFAFPSANTSYIANLSTSNGCATNDTVSVNVASFSIHAHDTILHCRDSVSIGLDDNYKGLNALAFKWSPTIYLNDSLVRTPFVKAQKNISYRVQASSWNGCMAGDSFTLNLAPPNPPAICLVGVNGENKNQIIWEKNSFNRDTFFIYRETNQTDVYMQIGSKRPDEVFLFSDTGSNPLKQSNKYKLSVKDACGLTSAMSVAHKTMHLTVNKGNSNSWNLIWNAYEGFTVQTYNVYRGDDTTNLSLIGTSSGSNTSYTDLTAPTNNVYYQVEIISPNACNPGKTYNTSRSNQISTLTAGINFFDPSHNALVIYPNPSNEFIIIETGNEKGVLEIVNANGQWMHQSIVSGRVSLNCTDWRNGIYFIRFFSENRISTAKMMKE